MTADRQALAAFAALVQPGRDVPLWDAAVLLSALVDPTLEPGWLAAVEERVEWLTAHAAPWVDERDGPARPRVEALLTGLTAGLGFRGDAEDYHSPMNSSLWLVVRRHTGLPITMALVLVEIGRRLGLPFHPVAAPGHFLTGITLDGQPHLVDFFRQGRPRPLAEVAAAIAREQGFPVEAVLPLLGPAEPRAVLSRMLNNLRVAYGREGDRAGLLRTADWMLALKPDAIEERRTRGLLRLAEGMTAEGVADLAEWLAATPPGHPARAEVADQLRRFIAPRPELN